jgi:hypothetical protein
MTWTKRGFIYCATGRREWAALYAMMPVPVLIPDQDLIRIYVGVTSADKFGRTITVDVSKDDPSRVVAINDDRPLIDLGVPGAFDDSGAVPSCHLMKDDSEYLYYVGFQRTVKVPYMIFPGLCIRKHGEREYVRYSESPLMDRLSGSAFSLAAPFVMFDAGRYRMWLWIGKRWVNISGKPYMQAWIGYAESADAVRWEIVKEDCIVPDTPHEFSVGRPWVVKEDGKYKMYYSVRHVERMYRLGYAESSDGINWERNDKALGLDVSASGWDSEMMCYPSVINVGARTFMFYNGNKNGESGFGWAERTS